MLIERWFEGRTVVKALHRGSQVLGLSLTSIAHSYCDLGQDVLSRAQLIDKNEVIFVPLWWVFSRTSTSSSLNKSLLPMQLMSLPLYTPYLLILIADWDVLL